MATNNWKSEKARLSELNLENRRKEYSCGDKFFPLDQIQTWQNYFHDNEKALTEKVSEKDLKADPDLQSIGKNSHQFLVTYNFIN